MTHQRRAVADQHVASGGTRIKRMPRYGQHLAPLIQGIACSNKAAGPRGGLDDDRGLAETGNDPVAAGEMPRHRLQANGLFGNT